MKFGKTGSFWRRIRYKISIPNPTEWEFKRIFKTVCEHSKVTDMVWHVDFTLGVWRPILLKVG